MSNNDIAFDDLPKDKQFNIFARFVKKLFRDCLNGKYTLPQIDTLTKTLESVVEYRQKNGLIEPFDPADQKELFSIIEKEMTSLKNIS